jgi:hypothetical protein
MRERRTTKRENAGRKEGEMTAEEKVKAKWPRHRCDGPTNAKFTDPQWAWVITTQRNHAWLGNGATRDEAYKDAATRINDTRKGNAQ